MEVIGKFRNSLPETTGESAKGKWSKGGFVITTNEDKYPKTIAFIVWGEEKLAIVDLIEMDTDVKVFFNVESREFNDKWYTDLDAYRVDVIQSTQVVGGSYQKPNQAQPQKPLTNKATQEQPQSKGYETPEQEDDDSFPF